MKSILPLIVVILLLTGAITYTLSKNTLPKLITKQESVSPNELEVDSFSTPTPTASPSPKATATPTAKDTTKTSAQTISVSPTVVPTIVVKKSLITEASKEEPKIATQTITTVTKSTICTPIYGSANTCVEHQVVNTGAEDVIFFNLAGASYLAGLVAFVKAKRA